MENFKSPPAAASLPLGQDHGNGDLLDDYETSTTTSMRSSTRRRRGYNDQREGKTPGEWERTLRDLEKMQRENQERLRDSAGRDSQGLVSEPMTPADRRLTLAEDRDSVDRMTASATRRRRGQPFASLDRHVSTREASQNGVPSQPQRPQQQQQSTHPQQRQPLVSMIDTHDRSASPLAASHDANDEVQLQAEAAAAIAAEAVSAPHPIPPLPLSWAEGISLPSESARPKSMSLPSRRVGPAGSCCTSLNKNASGSEVAGAGSLRNVLPTPVVTTAEMYTDSALRTPPEQTVNAADAPRPSPNRGCPASPAPLLSAPGPLHNNSETAAATAPAPSTSLAATSTATATGPTGAVGVTLTGKSLSQRYSPAHPAEPSVSSSAVVSPPSPVPAPAPVPISAAAPAAPSPAPAPAATHSLAATGAATTTPASATASTSNASVAKRNAALPSRATARTVPTAISAATAASRAAIHPVSPSSTARGGGRGLPTRPAAIRAAPARTPAAAAGTAHTVVATKRRSPPITKTAAATTSTTTDAPPPRSASAEREGSVRTSTHAPRTSSTRPSGGSGLLMTTALTEQRRQEVLRERRAREQQAEAEAALRASLGPSGGGSKGVGGASVGGPVRVRRGTTSALPASGADSVKAPPPMSARERSRASTKMDPPSPTPSVRGQRSSTRATDTTAGGCSPFTGPTLSTLGHPSRQRRPLSTPESNDGASPAVAVAPASRAGRERPTVSASPAAAAANAGTSQMASLTPPSPMGGVVRRRRGHEQMHTDPAVAGSGEGRSSDARLAAKERPAVSASGAANPATAPAPSQSDMSAATAAVAPAACESTPQKPSTGGEEAEPQTATPVPFCIECGRRHIDDGAKFCAFCGHKRAYA